MTKYYAHINDNGQLQGWYADDIHDTIPDPHIEVSEDTWQEALTNGYNYYDKSDEQFKYKDFRSQEEINKETAKQIRYMRDCAIKDVLWLLERHQQEQILEIPLTLSPAEHLELLEYIQTLRNLPQQTNFPYIDLPQKPSFLTP